jgi:hypothetical protein
MKAVIKFYLLSKSAWGRQLTFFDIGLARVTRAWTGSSPWLEMIANMQQEAPLPEAFNDWRMDLQDRIVEFVKRMLGGE